MCVCIVPMYCSEVYMRQRIQKFPDWPPGARTANGIALFHYVQLYRYFVSQCNEFCRHNTFCCFSTIVHCCKHVFLYRLRKTLVFSRCVLFCFVYFVGLDIHLLQIKLYCCTYECVFPVIITLRVRHIESSQLVDKE
jgi:hypothetical protein